MSKKKKTIKKNSKQTYMEKKTAIAGILSDRKTSPKKERKKVDLSLKQITVQNAEGDPDTTATILIQNQIDYVPKVSVIIPVYNVEEYLRECLDSVVNQTLKDIEIICVDDGSTDKSLEILKEYAKKDKRMTIITQKNLYAGVARNAGLSQAKGEYLSFLDSDDFFELEMLEKAYNRIRGKNAEICIFGCYFYDNSLGNRFSPGWALRKEHIPSNDIFTSKDIAPSIFQLTNNWPWNKLFDRLYISKQKLFFQNTHHTNDTYFVALAIAFASKITVLDEKLVNYRMNVKNSLTTSNTRDKSPLDIDTVLYAMKNNLKNCFEKSFVSLCCNHLYWNLTNNISDLSKNILINAIIKHNFYDIPPHLPEEYFEDSKVYQKYLFLLELIPEKLKERNLIIHKIDNVKVVSFDIFDTIIVRPYRNPSDLFKHIAKHFSDNDFSKMRIEAEKTARTHAKCEEITLKEIYSYLPEKYQKFKWEEEKLEIQIAQVNPYIQDLINFIDKQGKKVILISDMYLDESIINKILGKFNLNKYEVYISSKINLTKSSGHLYDFVLKQQGIEPCDMLHIGDNPHSDKKIPEAKGIKVVPVQRYHEANNAQYLSDFNCDNLNKSILVSLAKFNLYHNNNGYWYNIGYCLGGPLANSFVNFIIQKSVENKIEELLFIARDGYILKDVYEIICKDHLPTHYIYASRGLIYNVSNDEKVSSEYRKYLNKQNINGSRLGCIDVTTINLSSQKFLSTFFPRKQIIGLYWLANELNDKNREYLNIFSRPHKVEGLNFLVETLLSAPHGPVNRIEKGEPICDEQSEAEKIRCKIYSEIAKGIIQFNEDITNIFSGFKVEISPSDVVDLIYNFLQKQTALDYEKFKTLTHSGNLFNSDPKQISTYFDKFIPVKISVIIAVYNCETFLPECLNSVTNQTLKEIEIICINDGSSDNSLSVLNEYASKDKRIVIINQNNQGLACSRNNAMKIAKGQYFVFLDADDYLRLDALSIIYKNIQEKQLDILSYSGINFDNNTRSEKINHYWEFKYLPKNFNYQKFNYRSCLEFMHEMAVSSCLTAYRRQLLIKNNIKFPDHLFFEDNLFFIKAITTAQYCGIIKEKLYYRRVHRGAITQNWDKHFSDYLKIVDLCLDYIKNIDPNLSLIYRKYYLEHCKDFYNHFTNNYRKKYALKLKILLKKYDFPSSGILLPALSFKTYLLFPYYFIRLKKLIKNKNSLIVKKIVSELLNYRIDVKNCGQAQNTVKIQAEDVWVYNAKWNTDQHGIGKTIEGKNLQGRMKLQMVNNGILKLDFRGQNRLYENERIPVWIDYKSIKIDGKEVLSMPVATWHDKPYYYEMPVKDGQEITLEVEQQYHQYTEDELRNILLKLNYNSEYVVLNIDEIIKELRKQLPIIDEETTDLLDLIRQNQAKTLDIFNEIKTHNALLEKKTVELEKQFSLLQKQIKEYIK